MGKIFLVLIIACSNLLIAQTVKKVLISGFGGQHDIDVRTAFNLGYASYDSTQYSGEILLYPATLTTSFEYANENGYDIIIRSTTGLSTGIRLAPAYPSIKLFMPSGSNSFVQTYTGDVINSPVIITGAGTDSNVTGYEIEFYSIDPITENNFSSLSNGYIAGQLSFIANSLQCSLDSARNLARSTGTNKGEFDNYNGFGSIITGKTLANPLPVELTFFTTSFNGHSVELQWKTETEVNNYGFYIERSNNKKEWESVVFVEGNGNSNSPKYYHFIDPDIGLSGSYYYKLKQIDNDGTFKYSDIVTIEVGNPNKYYLNQNYPNPFNPLTSIKFTLPQSQMVSLTIYDSMGELVRELVNEEKEAGDNTVNFDASGLASGIYIYRLQTDDFISNKKMILLK